MTQHGATPEHWAAWQSRELTADLLPVVSNPAAVISPMSKMVALGKTPSMYNRDRQAVGIPSWTQKQATPAEVKRWGRDSDLGICVQTRRVRAIDIDIADPVAAAAVQGLVEMGLGTLPARGRNNSGKVLLLIDMPGEFVKRVVRTKDGIIEFLANGQQCIVEGTHPSGVRYEWRDLGAEIPAVTPAEFEVVWAELSKLGLATEERRGVMPAVPRMAGDMQDPMVAFLADNGWVTGYERDGRVDVRCPWEDEHTADTGPSSTSWFPAGVGGFRQGHFRCLHAHCSGRTDGDFLGAVGYVAGDFDVVAPAPGEKPVAPLPAFTRTRDGSIEATLNNVLMALRREDVCGVRIGFDTFKSEMMLGEGGRWRYFKDADYVRLRSVLEMGANGFKPIGRDLIKDAARFIADEGSFDSAIQWAESLVWDGVPRVSSFFSEYFSVADSPYTRAVSRYLWSALAGRCVEPGVKADMVPALISRQGTGKTTMVEVLSPLADAFLEVDMSKKDEELAKAMRGKLIGELAELRGLQSKGAEGIKAWLSRKNEETRRLYEEFYRKQPRRLVFIATGNKEFLDDETGERRWLPMRVGAVNIAGIAAIRDQLWAEGLAMFRDGGVRWQAAQELAVHQHNDFKVSDEWEDVIVDWLSRDAMDEVNGANRGAGVVRVRDILLSAIRVELAEIDKKTEMRVAKVLAKLGYERDTHWVGGKAIKGWKKANAQCFADLA